MNTYWRQISENLQAKVSPGVFRVWIAPLRAELETTNGAESRRTNACDVQSTLAENIFQSGTDQASASPISMGAPTAVAQAKDLLAGQPDSAVLRVLAPNDFVANWVRNRLSEVITAATAEVLGAETRMVIEVAPVQEVPAIAPSTPKGPVQGRAASGTASDSQSRSPVVLHGEQPRRAEQLSLPVRTGTRAYNWRYGFDGFVVGPCNDMAVAAARNMLPAHGAVDTLFLSSGPGLGKTHLTQAVGQALCSAANRVPKVEYLSAESFCNAFVQSMKARDIDAFKSRFRDVDVLLLEDVHFLQGKEKMQVEVLSTIKSLQERGSRVVLTSTFAPRELNNLDPTLVSRFCSGFLAGMEKPDFPTRRRILLDKAQKSEAVLSVDVCDLMAERLSGDVRQLESCLYNLLLRAKLQDCKISLNMAADILAQYTQNSPFVNLDAITRRVCEGFGLNPEQLASRSRRNAHVTARNTVFYLARKHTELSLQDIGEHFNRRHSTVLKGIAAVERELTRETSLGRQIAATLGRIEARSQVTTV